MKLKHNKKRNTAFLFETLVRELTRAAIRKDAEASTACKTILKEHFSAGTVLYKELSMYRALYETYGLSNASAEKLLREVRHSYSEMVSKKSDDIFAEQSTVIKKINKNVSKSVFSNFVPHYKNIATVYQIFNGDLAPEKRVLLEEFVCDSLASQTEPKVDAPPPPIDNLVMKNFVKKFNDRYSGSLQEEQSKLLNKYVLSFADNGLLLKMYLHEEIARLREVVERGLKMEEVQSDSEMVQKTNQVLGILNSCSQKKIDIKMLESILKVQALAREIQA